MEALADKPKAKVTKTERLWQIKTFFTDIFQNTPEDVESPEFKRAFAAIKKALTVIQNNQTSDERVSDTVQNNNGKGWCPSDVEFGASLFHQAVEKGKLTPKQVKFAARMLSSYSRQLFEAAQAEGKYGD